jgi:trehalose 6-phosphate phosphatase
MENTPQWVEERLTQAKGIQLFLDYDGTLADFAPTPEDVIPDPVLIDLIRRLAQHPKIRVGVISGRRLAQIRELLPVPESWLAGTYGIELLTPEGGLVEPLKFASIRPVLEELKPLWEELIAGRQGIYLEDKGWSLAVHARFADETVASEVIHAARKAAGQLIDLGNRAEVFREHGGPRFYEVCPAVAHKGRAVQYLLAHSPWSESLPVYLGDDYNDEDAFEVVKANGGIAVLVLSEPRQTQADFRLENPRAARGWLEDLLDLVGGSDSPGREALR